MFSTYGDALYLSNIKQWRKELNCELFKDVEKERVILKTKDNIRIELLFSIFFFSINLLIISFWKFYQLHNDYWDLLFIAKNIDFNIPLSLTNPCIPVGYPTMLHFLIMLGSEVTVPIIVNLLFGTITIFASILFFRNVMSKKSSIISACLLCSFPQFFFYTNQGGADPGAVMFFTFGNLILLKQLYVDKKVRWSRFLISGILLGLGAILRYHVLVGASIIVFTAFILNLRQWKLLTFTALGVLIAYFPQIVLNLITHHSALETKLGASNIYDLMYGINWYKVTKETISTNAWEIISSDYVLFLKKYCLSFINFFLKTGLIPLIAFFFSKQSINRRLSLFTLIFVTVYFFIFSATLSSRQVLLPLPLTMMCMGILNEELMVFTKRKHGLRLRFLNTARVVSITFLFLIFLSKDIQCAFRNIDKHNLSSNIESYLISMGCTSALQTYTTDYDLYFRKLSSYTGYFNGGWSRWGTYKYNETFPEFNIDSLDGFINDCRRFQVRFVILTPNAEKLHPDLANIFDNKLSREDLVLRKCFQKTKIFEVM